MPAELQSMIARKLDALSFWNLKLVCKNIHMWTKDPPPKLSASEWIEYHSVFETHARRRRSNLQIMGCSGCKKHLDTGLFSDAEAHKLLNKGRLCISCAICKGSHDRRILSVHGQKAFGCRGCQKAKPREEEDTCHVDKAHWFEHFPRNREGRFNASLGCRWCQDCWAIIQNYRGQDRSPYDVAASGI